MVLGTAIPTSFHILGKFVIYYCYTVICTVAYKCIVAACKLYLCCFMVLFMDLYGESEMNNTLVQIISPLDTVCMLLLHCML